MVKLTSVEKIEDLEKKNLGYWLVVEITKRNRFYEGTHGRLLGRSKHRDPAYDQAMKYRNVGPLYIGYSGKPKNLDYCLWHKVVEV